MLGVESVRLITNNPEKVEALEAVGITVAERISAEVAPRAHLRTLPANQARKDGPPGQVDFALTSAANPTTS